MTEKGTYMFGTAFLHKLLEAHRDRKKITKARNIEIKKFEDPRRVEIYSRVKLSMEQKSEIDALYEKNYGEKIPYTWHRHYTAFTGNFDKYYFPELLFIPEFEKFMNLNASYAKVFEDKNILPFLAKFASVAFPRIFYSKTAELIRNEKNEVISEEQLLRELNDLGEGFIKPSVDSCSGQGCQVVEFANGYDKRSGKLITSVLQEKGADWTLQERLVCHESIRKIYANSVNTFRIMTYRWKEGIYHTPSIMRIGQGEANVDNAHAGGMFIAIDDNGNLHKTAFTEFKKEYTAHPDTHVVYENYKINLFPKVIDAAVKCHGLIPQIGVVNWDFTLNQNGEPVLIEANIMGGSVWLFEMAHGCGIFGERTPEILRWLRKIKNAKPKDRKKFRFGLS